MDKNVETIIILLRNRKNEIDPKVYRDIMTDISVCTYDTESMSEEQLQNIPNSKEWNDYAKSVYALANVE